MGNDEKRIIDILTNIPFANARIGSNLAEMIALILIANGVTFSTFKVGDVVWVYDFMWGILPCEIDEPYHCRSGKSGGCTFEMSFTEADVGRYVFSTKEEAESVWREKEVY